VIANGENSAGGSGITPKTAEEIFAAGVDIITSGDHLWDQKEVIALLENEKRFLRPLNYPPGAPGQGSAVFEIRNSEFGTRNSIAVLNLQGRTFMPSLENPFLLAAEEIERLREQTRIIFVVWRSRPTSAWASRNGFSRRGMKVRPCRFSTAIEFRIPNSEFRIAKTPLPCPGVPGG